MRLQLQQDKEKEIKLLQDNLRKEKEEKEEKEKEIKALRDKLQEKDDIISERKDRICYLDSLLLNADEKVSIADKKIEEWKTFWEKKKQKYGVQ